MGSAVTLFGFVDLGKYDATIEYNRRQEAALAGRSINFHQ
jgi:hypothetical protein